MRHPLVWFAASFTSLALVACGGVTDTGNGAGASSEGATGGQGGDDEGAGGDDEGVGGGGGTDGPGGGVSYGGSGGQWSGGQPGVAGGCSASGPFVPGTGGRASGGAQPVMPPLCPVDGVGFATTTLDELCSLYRCPESAAALLAGLICDEPASGDGGIQLISGCEVETVRFAGSGILYEATFPAGATGPERLRVGQDYPFGSCMAMGYEAGTERPPCPTETRSSCRQAEDRGGNYTGCREPGQAGCTACCDPWACGGGCNINTSTSGPGRYDSSYSSDSVACPCNCTPCAECTTDLEHQLRTLPEKPGCSCSAIAQGAGGAGGDSCYGTGGASAGGGGPSPECLSHCGYRESLARACPGIVN